MSLSKAKANKKETAVGVQAPQCPVCMDMMTAPIFQCKTGHSLCNGCTRNLHPPLCPICRQDMTQMRNWQLEDLVNNAKVPCPNKSEGCVRVHVMITTHVSDHLKECIFRIMDCPLSIFGKCSWNGPLKEIMLHFQDRHPNHCNLNSDTDVVLNDVDVTEDDRFVYLVNQGKMLFIITMKMDTLQKMSYWTIQHIGSKKSAQQHVYEIHVTSLQDPRRKIIFIDHCFNDSMKTDDVFRMGKCAMLPLDALYHYLKDKKLSFRFFIKKVPFIHTSKNANKDGENKPFNRGPGGKGPGPQGGMGPSSRGGMGPVPRGAMGPVPRGSKGPKGPGPHKHYRD